jgi:hypothetical protein
MEKCLNDFSCLEMAVSPSRGLPPSSSGRYFAIYPGWQYIAKILRLLDLS